MDLTSAEQVGQRGIVKVVSRTIQGTLRNAVEAFIQAQAGPRVGVAWVTTWCSKWQTAVPAKIQFSGYQDHGNYVRGPWKTVS